MSGMAAESTGTTDVIKKYSLVCKDEYFFFLNENGWRKPFFLLEKMAKVAEEKGDRATAFDRIRRRDVISL